MTGGTSQLVAVKMLKDDANESAKEAFKMEIDLQLSMKFDHQNVIALIGTILF